MEMFLPLSSPVALQLQQQLPPSSRRAFPHSPCYLVHAVVVYSDVPQIPFNTHMESCNTCHAIPYPYRSTSNQSLQGKKQNYHKCSTLLLEDPEDPLTITMHCKNTYRAALLLYPDTSAVAHPVVGHAIPHAMGSTALDTSFALIVRRRNSLIFLPLRPGNNKQQI